MRALALAFLTIALHQGTLAFAQQAPPPPPPPAGPPSQKPPPVTATIAGRVVAADTGQPVRLAEIRLVSENTVPTLVARTDDTGLFELPIASAGSYSLAVGKAGFVTTPFGLSRAQPGPFTVSPGQKINVGDLALPRGGVIAGRILDARGDPIAEAVVYAHRLSFLTPAVRRSIRLGSTQTNDLGDFRLHGLSPGKYYVSATPGGFVGGSAPVFYPGSTSIAEATPVEVRAGQESLGIAMQLTPAQFGGVSGTVVDSKGRPFSAANVWLVPVRADGVLLSSGAETSTVTDAAGRFAINNVSPGDYRLEAFSRAWMENYSKAGDSAGPPPEVGSVPISITSGRTEEVSVRASAGFRIRGQVLVDGVPMSAATGAGVYVTATAPMASILSVGSVRVTDGVLPDGTFTLTGVHGLRLLRVSAAPRGVAYHHTTVAGADVSETGIEITADIAGVEIHLTSRPARVEGDVVDTTGAPVTDATIVLFSTNRSDWLMPGPRRYLHFKVNGQGKFSASTMPAGNYLAALMGVEDADRWHDPDYVDSLRAKATPFTLTDGSTTALVITKK